MRFLPVSNGLYILILALVRADFGAFKGRLITVVLFLKNHYTDILTCVNETFKPHFCFDSEFTALHISKIFTFYCTCRLSVYTAFEVLYVVISHDIAS
jgi:hypothetical protein